MFRVQHVAQLLQSAVLGATTGGVSQIVHDVRHVHFTYKQIKPELFLRAELRLRYIKLSNAILIKN